MKAGSGERKGEKEKRRRGIEKRWWFKDIIDEIWVNITPHWYCRSSKRRKEPNLSIWWWESIRCCLVVFVAIFRIVWLSFGGRNREMLPPVVLLALFRIAFPFHFDEIEREWSKVKERGLSLLFSALLFPFLYKKKKIEFPGAQLSLSKVVFILLHEAWPSPSQVNGHMEGYGHFLGKVCVARDPFLACPKKWSSPRIWTFAWRDSAGYARESYLSLFFLSLLLSLSFFLTLFLFLTLSLSLFSGEWLWRRRRMQRRSQGSKKEKSRRRRKVPKFNSFFFY